MTKQRAQESGKVVDVLNEERGQKVNKLKIVEKERSNLGGAKAEAEEFMMQQRKLVTKKAVLYQVRTAHALAAVGQETSVDALALLCNLLTSAHALYIYTSAAP